MKKLAVIKHANGFYTPVRPVIKGAMTLEELERFLPEGASLMILIEEPKEELDEEREV